MTRRESNIADRENLLRALCDPGAMQGLTVKEWEALIPQARFAGVWPHLAAEARRRGIGSIPPAVSRQMEAVLCTADNAAVRYRWEINRLHHAFGDVACPLILLKGAAYLARNFAWAEGRSFQDIDVLVPRDQLNPVETALRRRGWTNSIQNPLDVAYFRTWLQELAPMWHPERKIQADLHHTIIPPRDRLRFDPQMLFEDARAVHSLVYTLSDADMILHAGANLFWTGEFTSLLRDLFDVHSMLGDFSRQPDFWPHLLSRAERLNLTRSLYYAVRYVREIFHTPVPPEIADQLERWRPGRLPLAIVDALVHRTLFPHRLDEVDTTRQWALTLREYWSVPRLGVICTTIFWLKRLPAWLQVWLGLKPSESDRQPPRELLPR